MKRLSIFAFASRWPITLAVVLLCIMSIPSDLLIPWIVRRVPLCANHPLMFVIDDIVIAIILVAVAARFDTARTRLAGIRSAIEREERERARISSQIRNRERLFAIFEHDLRQPLAALIAEIDLLAISPVAQGDSFRTAACARIQTAAGNLGGLFSSLGQWIRSQQIGSVFKPEEYDMRRAFAHAMDVHAQAARRKNVRIRIQTGRDLVVRADPDMINSVIRNLLSNAIKFSRRGGQILLSAHRTDGQVRLTVEDAGTGIPEGDMDLLFDYDRRPVRSGTEREKGNGLGLLLCKEFTEAHGGRIEIQCGACGGTSVSVTLPQQGPKGTDAPDPAAAGAAPLLARPSPEGDTPPHPLFDLLAALDASRPAAAATAG